MFEETKEEPGRLPASTRAFLGMGVAPKVETTPKLPSFTQKGAGDEFSEKTAKERRARFNASADMLFSTDLAKLSDIGAAALYQSVTEGMFGMADTDGSMAFGKRAAKDMQGNLELLRRFVKGEYNLIEDPEYTKWREMDEEAKFQYALKNEKFFGDTMGSLLKGERGPSTMELITHALTPAPMKLGPLRTEMERETQRKMRYEDLTEEEKAAYRADVIGDYDEKLSRRQTLATFLQYSEGLSDRASYLLAKSFNEGQLDVANIRTLEKKEERDRVYSAFKLMRGYQEKGRILGIETDFTDDTAMNRLQLMLYGVQGQFTGFFNNTIDLGKDLAITIYAKTALDEQERKDFFAAYNALSRAESAMKQPLPEADGFVGELMQGVAENFLWLVPYGAMTRGGKMVTGAAKGAIGAIKGARTEMAIASEAKTQGEAIAAALRLGWLRDVEGAAKAGQGARKLSEFSSAIALKRQIAAVDRLTDALKAIPKARNAALLQGAKEAGLGATEWAIGEAMAVSTFAREYLESADAAGISREESVFTAAAVALINAGIEKMYWPGMESTLSPAQLKSMMWTSARQAIKTDGAAGFRKWLANRIPRDLEQMVKVTITEGAIEEPLQQMVIEHAKAFDALCESLNETDRKTAKAFWQSFAETLPNDWATFVDTTIESLPTSVGFGLDSVGMAKLRQHTHNILTRHANRRAGSGTTMAAARTLGELQGATDYDIGLADYIQRSVEVNAAMEEFWSKQGGETNKNPNRFKEAITAARRAFRQSESGDTVKKVADAAGVDVKTAEVLAQYLEVEEEMTAFSPKARAWSSINMSLADIDETTIKTLLPGYVEGSFASNPDLGVYSGKVKLGDGTERTIAYHIGDISAELMAEADKMAKADSAFGKSYDARMSETGTLGQRWAEMSDAERYTAALRAQMSVNGFSTGKGGVFELTDAKGEKVRVNADDVIRLASGRIADIGYGPAATQATVRHETFHSLWRFARAALDDGEVQNLAKSVGIDVTKDDWEVELDEKMAHEMEQYASGHYVSHAVSSRFDKLMDGWAGKLIDFIGELGGKDEVTDPKTGKPFQLKELYDKVLRGELGSGSLGVELRAVTPEVPEGEAGATTSAMPVEVTEKDRAEAEAEEREAAAETKTADLETPKPVPETPAAPAATPAATKPVEPATAEKPADASTPNQRFYKIGLPNSDVKLVGRLEVRDAKTGLITSTDAEYHDRGNQNRDDKSEESRALVEKIGANPDPLQIGTVQPIANNGIVWALPNGDVIIGNHRVNGVRLGYEKGTAEALDRFVREDAAKRGIEVGADVARPIPVFILERIESPDGKADEHEVVRLANESQNRGFNVREQAQNDAKILVDNNLLPRMEFRPDGRIDETKSGDAIGKFRQETGAQGMVGEDGMLTEEGQTRIQNAALAALLAGSGSNALLQKIMSNAGRLDMATELRALMKMTPELMALAEQKPGYDLRKPLAEALQLFTEWRDKDETSRVEKGKTRHDWRETAKDGHRIRGLSWETFMSQGDMFRVPSAETRLLGDMLAKAEEMRSFDREDIESAAGKKRVIDYISDFITDYIANAKAVNTETVDLFGAQPATTAELLGVAAKMPVPAATAAEPQKQASTPSAEKTGNEQGETLRTQGEAVSTQFAPPVASRFGNTGMKAYQVDAEGKATTQVKMLPPGVWNLLRAPYDVRKPPAPSAQDERGRGLGINNPPATKHNDIFPHFQGNKTEMADRTTQAIRNVMSKTEREHYTTVVDYFGGGGCWGLYHALENFPNAKKLVINEFDPDRLGKIRLLQEIGGEVASEAAAIIKSEEVFERLRKAANNSSSPVTIANKVESIVKGEIKDERQRAALQAFIDCAKTMLATSKDENGNPINDTGLGVDRALENLKADGEKAKKAADEFKARGGTIEYRSGDAAKNDDLPHGDNVVAVADPPYYRTADYQLGTILGLDEVPDNWSYKATEKFLKNLVDLGDAIVYTDEAWWNKEDYQPDLQTDFFSGGRSLFEREQEVMLSITETLSNFDVAGRVAGRQEVLGVHHKVNTTEIQDATDGKPEGGKSGGAVRPEAAADGRGEQGAGSAVSGVAAEPEGQGGRAGETGGDGGREGDRRYSVRLERERKIAEYAANISSNAKRWLADRRRKLDRRMKAAGYTERVWHGTNGPDFNRFEFSDRHHGAPAAYFTYSHGTAQNYAALGAMIDEEFDDKGNPNTREFYVNPGRMLDIDEDKPGARTNLDDFIKLVKKAYKDGYDSIRVKNAYDDQGFRLPGDETLERLEILPTDENHNIKTDILIVFDREDNPGANRIKAADEVTFLDDEFEGEAIPLRLRGDATMGDVRYSTVAPMSKREIDRAVEYFGTTQDPKEAAYILPDGRWLDYEQMGEHWEISQAFTKKHLGEAESLTKFDGDAQPYVDAALKAGLVRVAGGIFDLKGNPKETGLQFGVMPTADTIRNMLNFFDAAMEAYPTLRTFVLEDWTTGEIRSERYDLTDPRAAAQVKRDIRALADTTRYSVAGVFTGSMADYEKPSLHMVGTGEGSQVYGWGLYGSSVRGIAEEYAKMGTGASLILNGEKRAILDKKYGMVVRAVLYSPQGTRDSAIQWLQGLIDEYGNDSDNEESREYKSALSWLKNPKNKIKTDNGNIYEQTFFTDRKPGDESHLLLWYEPVPTVQKAKVIKQLNKEHTPRYKGAEDGTKEWTFKGGRLAEVGSEWNYPIKDGQQLYWALDRILGTPQAASEFLVRAGIDGVKYPADSFGKGVKDGDEVGWNYVSFRDDNIRVDHKWVDGQQRFSIAADYGTIFRDGTTEHRLRNGSPWMVGRVSTPFTDYLGENHGIKIDGEAGTPVGTKVIRDAFEAFAPDEKQRALFTLVLDTAEKLGVDFRIDHRRVDDGDEAAYELGGHIVLHADVIDRDGEKSVARTILHELIHGVTSYAIDISENEASVSGVALPHELHDAVRRLRAAYNANLEWIKGEYGATNLHEFVAELSNPDFRQRLERKGWLERTIDSIVDMFRALFGMDKAERPNEQYDRALDALKDILANYDKTAFDTNQEAATRHSAVSALTKAMTIRDALAEAKKGLDPDAVVLVKIGSFYEAFGDDAKTAAPIIGATLTTRNGNPMCGVPDYVLNSALAKFIRNGKTVVLTHRTDDGTLATDRVIEPGRYSTAAVSPWPKDFPKVILQTTLKGINNKWPELHEKAKAGDRVAALELVRNIMGEEPTDGRRNTRWEKLRSLAKAHPNAIIAFVHAQEATGRNRLPETYARMASKITGLRLTKKIVQTVRANHTGANALERMMRRAAFDGPVERGAEYIIVDDHVTQGGTLNELRKHIQTHGGKVVAATTLTASQFSDTLSITSDAVEGLYAKFGKNIDEQLKAAGIAKGVEELTQSEARELRKFKPDTLREQLASSVRNIPQDEQGGAGEGSVRAETLQPDAGRDSGAAAGRRGNGPVALRAAGNGLRGDNGLGDQGVRYSTEAARPSIYPQLRSMSDTELLSAAVAVKMALGTTGKFSDKAVTVNTVQRLMKRLHPEYNSTDVGRESLRVLSEAKRFGKKIREDLDRGVSDSLILEHLPQTMRQQFGHEMHEEARRGQSLGVFGQKVVSELEERQNRVVEDAVRVQTGIDAAIMENEFGIDLSATLMHLAENPLTDNDNPPPPASAGAAEEDTTPPAEEKEVDKKVVQAVSAVVDLAKRYADENAEIRKERKAQKQEQQKTEAGEAAGENLGESLPASANEAVAVATRKAGLNLENPRHLAEFVAELTRRYWIKEHGLALNADVWRDRVAVQFLRKTAQSVYAKLCKDLTYSRSRETAMQHIAKLDNVPTLNGLLSEMEFVGALINRQRIWDTQQQMCDRLDLFLRERFGAQGRFRPDKEEGKRNVSTEAELRARYMRHAMWLTPDSAAEEARQLQETLDALAADFKDAGRDVDQSREFVETIRKLNVLREFGALRYKPVGEIEAAVRWWEDFERGDSDEILREQADRDIRTKKAAHLLAVAFADPKRKTIREGGKGDALNRFITGHMGFISLLQDCMRHASDADAAAVKNIIDYIAREVQKGGDRAEAEKRRHNDAFHSVVERIYGRSFDKVMAEMMAPDERFMNFMGTVGGKRVTPTKARAMQLLVSLLQEGRKVEVEDDDGNTSIVWEGGYHDNIVKHGRVGQAQKLMRLMSPADMNMIKWLGRWYEQNRTELSDTCQRLFGIGVYAELPNYFPVKMLLEKQGLEKGEGVGWTIFPKALTPRVKNERDFDTSMDIFQMWASRMEEAAQWKGHALLGLEMRGIFGRTELRQAVRANHGTSVDDLMQGFITDILAGHGAYDRSTGGVQYFSDQIRGWTALCALGGNVGVMAKQTTSMPAFGFEIGLVNTAKYMVNAFTPEGMTAMRHLWNSEQRKTRWMLGSSEAVRNALEQNGAGTLKRMLQASMLTNKAGDVVPALVVGQGIYRDCLERGMSEEDAMAETWSIIERTQQSGRMENQTSIQRRNKLGRVMFQFLSTQQQYLQYEARAIREVIARPDSVKRWGNLGRAILLNHFILSSAYYWMGELYKYALGQEPPEDELKDWVITCLLGPYGSLFVAGFCCKYTLERAIKGYSIRGGSTMLPMESWLKTQINDGARLLEAIFSTEGDTWDNLLDAAGRWMGDLNSTVRDLRKIYRYRVEGEK
jgi:hypothetical protein